ncbi:DUF5522 domain-containing protein [Pedobacter steynii]
MKEGVDYYFNENGFMVFTEAYHLKRGYCCKNKCKHCPWDCMSRHQTPKNEKGARKTRKSVSR